MSKRGRPPGPVIDRPDDADDARVASDPRSAVRRWGAGLLGLGALLAFLPSSLLGLLGIMLTPKPGLDLALVILKLVDAVGWFGIGAWLLFEWGRLRFRVVAPAAIGWVWTYVLLWVMAGVGFMDIGY